MSPSAAGIPQVRCLHLSAARAPHEESHAQAYRCVRLARGGMRYGGCGLATNVMLEPSKSARNRCCHGS